MFCKFCGHENDDSSAFCVKCGKPLSAAPENFEAAPPSLNPVMEKASSMIRDNMFLIMCILVTVSAGVGLLGGNFSVLTVLFTIFLWLTYSHSKNGFADGENMRRISGTVYASYVISIVVVALLGVVFVVLGGIIALGFAGGALNLDNILNSVISEFSLDSDIVFSLASLSAVFISVVLVICFIALIAVFIVYIIGCKKLHGFAKSLYQSVYSGRFELINVTSAKNWLLAFGILKAVGALGSIASFPLFISAGCSAAVYFIASVLVDKYFIKE